MLYSRNGGTNSQLPPPPHPPPLSHLPTAAPGRALPSSAKPPGSAHVTGLTPEAAEALHKVYLLIGAWYCDTIAAQMKAEAKAAAEAEAPVTPATLS
ncbi:MAG: hypothetical protein IPK16_30165 [Anaerolineales bacterium]|nr:hypothetical protein [Anaerolineales bacterium]